jgi:hypothetical protein
MTKPTKPTLGEHHPIDVNKLIESRLLIQANSGSGKSWAIRRLLEQTYMSVPQIVIDVEGEFHTLREKFDYVLAGQKSGDCPADIKSAAMLARRLLELNVSAIVDIYELGLQRALFVRRFLESLVNAPRELWHPLLVVVDEAHMFAPESGVSESASAVIDLMTRGRKRGFCGVLATQRIAKLHKDAAAESNNKLIGRSALDIDMKRAAAELGFTSREDTQKLRTLPVGTFYGFGPAISDVVTEIQIGPVATTHPKAGERAIAPTPPRDKVKKILAQLADLPHEAEAEAKSVAELREQIKQLRSELTRTKNAQPIAAAPRIDKVAEKAKERVLHEQLAQARRLEALLEKGDKLQNRLNQIAVEFKTVVTTLKTSATPTAKVMVPHVVSVVSSTPRREVSRAANGALPIGEQAVLRALIQYPAGLRRDQLTVLTGYARSTRDAYLSRLHSKDYVDTNGVWFATDAGCAAMPDAEPLPTGEALREFWYRELPEGERVVLQHLVEAYPEPVEKPVIDEITGYKRSTRDAYLSRLTAKQLVTDSGRGAVKASETLFEVNS